MGRVNIDDREITKFSAHAKLWWEAKGGFRALHDINPVRLDYIRRRSGLAGKQVLDVGCGGGLLTEAMAACRANVTGIDMAAPALEVARAHMHQSGLKINYRQITAEDLADQMSGHFDVVTCTELIEHVPVPSSLIKSCYQLARPGGHLFFATVNRTWLARLLVIMASEYFLCIVPKGTHRFDQFIKPDELKLWALKAGLLFKDLSGLRYVPFVGYAALCRDTRMNYMMHFQKPI